MEEPIRAFSFARDLMYRIIGDVYYRDMKEFIAQVYERAVDTEAINYKPYQLLQHYPFDNLSQFMLPRSADQIPILWTDGNKWYATYMPPRQPAPTILDERLGWSKFLSGFEHKRKIIPTADYNRLLFGFHNTDPNNLKIHNFIGAVNLPHGTLQTTENEIKSYLANMKDNLDYPHYALLPVGKSEYYLIPFKLMTDENAQTIISYEFETNMRNRDIVEAIRTYDEEDPVDRMKYANWLDEKSIEHLGFRLPLSQLRKEPPIAYYDASVRGSNAIEMVITGGHPTNMIFTFHHWSNLMEQYIHPDWKKGDPSAGMHISTAVRIPNDYVAANYLYGVYGVASYLLRNSKRVYSEDYLGFRCPSCRGNFRLPDSKRLEIRFPGSTLNKSISIPMFILAQKMARDVNILSSLGIYSDRELYTTTSGFDLAEIKDLQRQMKQEPDPVTDSTRGTLLAKFAEASTLLDIPEDRALYQNMIAAMLKHCASE